MTMTKEEIQGLQEELSLLRRQLDALSTRIASLGGQPAAAEAPAAPPPAPPAQIGEEVLAAISAALAAYFGKRPPIRAIRLLGSGAWAQEGRVSIQASHRLNVPHHRHR
jgi:methylmalonyl-CoA carboxyltransferase large subunit